ncbi:hypothetical protein KRX57_06840 [Weeksellaceae bacterium TAE3-ERU29]|nr:hypothetical protein [Weeksellaceae bacterium TAE3-ERU29]
MFFRNTLSVIAGLSVAIGLILLAITTNKTWFDELSGIQLHQKGEIILYWQSVVRQAPDNFFLTLLISYGVGSTIGGVITALLVKTAQEAYAMLIGFILFAIAIADIVFVEGHPTWYCICIFFVFFPFSWLGGKIVNILNEK